MSKWSNARFNVFYYDCKAEINQPCDMALADGEISISYQDEADEGSPIQVVYKGRETSPRHFEPTAPMLNGRATPHRFPDAELMIGEWIEDGYSGM